MGNYAADVVELSPNRTSPRNHAIDTITIHCTAGQGTAQHFADYFKQAPRKAAPNYVVGSDCKVALCVDEADRSWCSSSAANDNRAVTIEVSSDAKSPYMVADDVWEVVVRLVTDICRRNGIRRLDWLGDDKTYASRERAAGSALLTLHKWFADKACPGPYIIGRLPGLSERVTRELMGGRARLAELLEEAATILRSM